MMIQETLQTPVTDSCDVLVCGGGFGGISAALAAGRLGKKVILLEKQYMLGGLGTAGLITIYLPLCDGCGRQVSFGIAEELLMLSISMGAEAEYPANWLGEDTSHRTEKDQRFRVQYNPQLFAMLAEKLLQDSGVEILYGTDAVCVSMDGDRIGAVIVQNKSGRQAILVKTVVDASGDCDIARFSGAPTENFKQGNVLAGWYYSLGEKAGYKLNMVGVADIPDDQKTESNQVTLLIPKRFFGLDGKEISQMVQLSHGATMNSIRKQREKDPSVVPVTISTTPQIRMTRRIVGEYTLHDTQMHTYFEDSIGMVPDWRKRGPVYEVPFSTLYSAKVKNLITAGRCTSVTDSMWDIMRVIPCCAVTGQAAGTAAALCDDFTQLDVSTLQEQLRQDGAVLHEQEL